MRRFDKRRRVFETSTLTSRFDASFSRGSKLFYRRGEELVAVTYRTTNGRFIVEREDTVMRVGKFSLVGIAPDGR